MSITAREISEKRFSMAFRGYNVDEVDDFLDYIMDEVDLLLRERNKAEASAPVADGQDNDKTRVLNPEVRQEKPAARSAEPAFEMPAAPPVTISEPKPQVPAEPVQPVEASAVKPAQEENVSGMGMLLQQTLITAQKTANEVVNTANRNADEIIRKAQMRADEIVREAQAEADRILNDARHTSDSLLKDKEDIVNYINMQKVKYRAYLEAQISFLDEKGVSTFIDE